MKKYLSYVGIRKIGSEILVETRIDGATMRGSDKTRSHVIASSDAGIIRSTILFTTSFSGLLTGKNFTYILCGSISPCDRHARSIFYIGLRISLSFFSPPLRGEIYLTKVGALRNERSLTSRIKPRFIRIEILGQRESHPPLRKFV